MVSCTITAEHLYGSQNPINRSLFCCVRNRLCVDIFKCLLALTRPFSDPPPPGGRLCCPIRARLLKWSQLRCFRSPGLLPSCRVSRSLPTPPHPHPVSTPHPGPLPHHLLLLPRLHLLLLSTGPSLWDLQPLLPIPSSFSFHSSHSHLSPLPLSLSNLYIFPFSPPPRLSFFFPPCFY